MSGRFAALACLASVLLAGCAYAPKPAPMSKLPIYPSRPISQVMLNDLPPAERPVAVAVYGFSDQTGQFKPSNLGQTLSRAISQGSSAMLMKSLQEAGQRSWFTIAEREQLKDLLNERQIIRDMRAQYLGEKGVNPQALPSLLFAGVLLEGGVVGYDTNTLTGGAGASILGIGATTKYVQDTVTIYLRAVSVKTGEVLTSVTASKTITSYAVDANIFRYVDSDKILQTEAGFTTNEPGMMALQQAIDKAVYGLVMEGVDLKLWAFADPGAAAPLIDRYHRERGGLLTPQQVAALEQRGRQGRGSKPNLQVAKSGLVAATPTTAATYLPRPHPSRPPPPLAGAQPSPSIVAQPSLVASAHPPLMAAAQPSPSATAPRAESPVANDRLADLLGITHSPAPLSGADGSTAPSASPQSE